MKEPLKGITVAIVGQLRGKDTDIQRWVRNNSGSYSTTVNRSVTHLICSMDAFKAKCAKVRQALKLGIWIVSYDWLEDSLMKKRPLKERGDYVMWRLEIRQRKERKRALRQEKKVDRDNAKKEKLYKQSIEEYHLEMGARTHHIYLDSTGFVYDILLSRVVNISTNKNEHFHIKLYESNAIPRLYAAVARYRRPGKQAVEILAPTSSFFDVAFKAFRAYFKRFTGYVWEDRLDSANLDVAEAVRTKTVVRGGKQTEETERLYRYVPPKPDKPRGLIHPDKILPEVIEISDGDDEEDDEGNDADESGAEEETEDDDDESGEEETSDEGDSGSDDGSDGSGDSGEEEEASGSDDPEGDSSDEPTTDGDAMAALESRLVRQLRAYLDGVDTQVG